jgi:LPS export ABC transporter protein LptC
MAVYSRNLLLFLALSGAALATWMLSRVPEPPPLASRESQGAPQGYYLVDATLRETDADGRIRFTIQAQRFEQLPASEDFELEGIRVEYETGPDSRWQLEATSGFMPGDRSYFDLRDVRILLTRSAEDGIDSATFETSELRLDAEKMTASTDKSVKFANSCVERVAEGMTLNLDAGTYAFGSNVTTICPEP